MFVLMLYLLPANETPTLCSHFPPQEPQGLTLHLVLFRLLVLMMGDPLRLESLQAVKRSSPGKPQATTMWGRPVLELEVHT